MKINEIQLQLLFIIARASIEEMNTIGCLNQQARIELVNEILNQQSNELIEVGQVESSVGKIEGEPDTSVTPLEPDIVTEGCDLKEVR